MEMLKSAWTQDTRLKTRTVSGEAGRLVTIDMSLQSKRTVFKEDNIQDLHSLSEHLNMDKRTINIRRLNKVWGISLKNTV